mmetsp:Transcript_115555/g.367393  ORF Transcript_115555/g.367393 Transcript_115555/m.367393 type:complete len:219 (-) Transcript_115555:1613-2269(-)
MLSSRATARYLAWAPAKSCSRASFTVTVASCRCPSSTQASRRRSVARSTAESSRPAWRASWSSLVCSSCRAALVRLICACRETSCSHNVPKFCLEAARSRKTCPMALPMPACATDDRQQKTMAAARHLSCSPQAASTKRPVHRRSCTRASALAVCSRTMQATVCRPLTTARHAAEHRRSNASLPKHVKRTPKTESAPRCHRLQWLARFFQQRTHAISK